MIVVLGLAEVAALLWSDKILAPAGWTWMTFELRFGLAFAAYLAAVAWIWRRPPRGAMAWAWVIAVGLGLRLVFALEPPVLSGNIYRYAWDGRVALEGINPYAYAPAAAALASLRDATVWPHLANLDWRTPYPPLAQAAFAVVALFRQGSVVALKLAWVAADAASVWLLARLLRRQGQDPLRAVVYAWHPLVITEFAQSGHVDALAIPFLLAALWWSDARAGVAAGLAALAKGYPLAVLPALPWTGVAVALGTVVAGYLPFGRHALDSVRGMFAEVRFDALLPGHWGGLLYAAVALAVLWRVRDRAWAMLLLAAAAVAASPVVMPWYLAWLVPLLALRMSPALLWATGVSMLSYFDYVQGAHAAHLGALAWRWQYGSIAALMLAEGGFRLWRSRWASGSPTTATCTVRTAIATPGRSTT